MKKFLFISEYFDDIPCGAYNNCHAHYEVLSNLFAGRQVISTLSWNKKEKPEPEKISLRCSRNRFDVLKNLLHGKNADNSQEAERRIIDIVMRDSYDLIWFDDYWYGSTVKEIKQLRPELLVYVFHHTVAQMKLSVLKNLVKLKGAINILKSISHNVQQKFSAQYADVNVILNDRDSETFSQLYNSDCGEQLILPACFIDTAHINTAEKKSEEFNIFFVGGGRHFPNVQGIKWFCKNVMPHLDGRARLLTVGADMDKFKDDHEFQDSRISITGRVESLDPYYNMADLVICPIFIGAGMMTKVAEAMMYGKNILATSHALNGYPEIEVQCRCDTPEEFITRINAMIENGTERFNPEMRRIFEEKYSIEAMTKTLREDFQKRGIL